MPASQSVHSSQDGDGPSHTYDASWTSLLPGIVCTVLTLLVAGAAVSALVHSPLLPPSRFLSDADTVILGAKATLARQSPGADLALVGDSSCLMNMDVPTLQSHGLRAVNLGTLSYLGVDSFGLLARTFAGGRPSARIVLVVHPECLRRTESSAPHQRVLEAALGLGREVRLQPANAVAEWLGLDALQARVLDRWMPVPLRGDFGVRYGFTESLEAELVRRGGTMDETARLNLSSVRVSPEYRLASRIEAECRAFRAGLPPGSRVRVVLSPVPRSLALRNHGQVGRDMMARLEDWLAADRGGANLPLVLEDEDFGTPTHLTPEAARRYSLQAARMLADWK